MHCPNCNDTDVTSDLIPGMLVCETCGHTWDDDEDYEQDEHEYRLERRRVMAGKQWDRDREDGIR